MLKLTEIVYATGTVLLVILLCLGLFACQPNLSTSISLNEVSIPDFTQLPVSFMHGSFAFDIHNLHEVVGDADLFFIGQVEQILKTEYRRQRSVMTESGEVTIGSPYTHYLIHVKKVVKGDLITDVSIELVKEGGVTMDGNYVQIFEDDQMMEVGKTYAISTYIQGDGSLLVSGSNSNLSTAFVGEEWSLLEKNITAEKVFAKEKMPVGRRTQRYISKYDPNVTEEILQRQKAELDELEAKLRRGEPINPRK